MTVEELTEALRVAPRYRSVAVVRAERLTAARSWRSGRGAELRARRGDWQLSDDSGASWTVADDIFRRTYRRRADGLFAKSGTVRAIQVSAEVEVPTLEGPARAEPGDWVLRGADDDIWPVTDEHFQAHYRPVR